MKIELMARWIRFKEDKRPLKERQEDERLRRLLGKEEDEYDAEENIGSHSYFTYDPLTIDTQDIIAWNKFDEEHTTIRTTLGEGTNFIIRTPYEIFSTFHNFVTGEGSAKKPEEFQFQVRMATEE